MNTPAINIDASFWTNLWAMEPTALRNFAANAGKAVAQQTQPTFDDSEVAAIIPIVGPISKYPSVMQQVFGGVSTIDVQSRIEKALYDDSISRIVLFIDSPGGTVAGTSDLGNYIATAKELKPIIAYVSDHCFSAAYWVASQCSAIVCNEGGFVGSIGVYSVLTDSSKAAEQAGFKVTLVSAGEFKGLEEPGLALDPKAIDETQREVNAAYQLFTSAVSSGRNLDQKVVTELADGRIHVAAEAVQLKLIDAIGTLQVAQTIGVSNMENNKDAKALATVKADNSDDMLDLLKQCLAAITSLSEKKADEDEDDDEASKSVESAVAQQKEVLKAISEACGGRSDFAMKAFLEGKSPVEAKAALADVLQLENETLRKKVAVDVVEPFAAGNVAPVATDDPEAMWAQNIGDVQKAYSGKKEYFLAAMKYNKNKGAK